MTIYCLENCITGKKYVGQTTGILARRLASHRWRAGKEPRSFALSGAIQKYGWKSFKAKVLQVCAIQEELNAAEIFWIQKLNTIAPSGYNIRIGGSRGRHHPRTRAFLSARVITPEWRAKIGAAHRGKKLSPEHRDVAVAALRRAKRVCLNGEQNGRAKLTRIEVEEIKAIYETGGLSQEVIAAAYGVNQTAVGFIVRGVHWK